MKVVAFVPIKLNNQRLPGKNLLPLADKPLCTYLFDTLRQVKQIDEKYVYCSDKAILPYIPEGLTFLERPRWLDGFEVKGLEIIQEFVDTVDADVYVLTHVTSPFMKISSFETAIEKVASGQYDSAFAAEEIKNYCWYEGQPVNFDPENIVRTQDVTPIYVESGGFFIFKKEVFTKLRRRIGIHPYIHASDKLESIDIDTREDFALAQGVARVFRGGGMHETR